MPPEKWRRGRKPIEILQEQFLGNVLDLHGCSPEELCYILGKGTPIIAMTDLNNAVLLIGYNDSMITYVKTGYRREGLSSV